MPGERSRANPLETSHQRTELVALATEAVRRQDWSEALTAWKRVRDRLPDHPAGIVWHAVALRELGRVDEAELVIAEGVTQFPTNTAILVEWARVAEKRRAWVEAMSRWETVRLSSPDIVEGHLGVGTALREVGQFDAAEATLAEALRGFPANPHLLIAQAWVAQNRRDWQEARSRWETVSSVCPGLVNGPLGVGTALRELGELDAADMTFTDAIARFPANPHLMIAYAWVAQKRPDWPATLLRWETVRSLHPHLVEGHLGIGTALREMGELEQADEFLSESIRRFPNNLYLLLAHARVAQARKNWEQALRRWEALRSVYPDIVDGYLGAGAALRELGRFEPAETLLSRALDHFPDSLNLRVDHARLAESVHNWGLALIRWEAACALAPDDEQLARYTGHARYQNQLVTIPLDAGVREPRAPAAIILETGEISPRDLMMHFESLGCGCEFGVVQRHFGAEPLGLLRWGSIAPLNLAKALQVRFEGMGDPKQARLSETPAGNIPSRTANLAWRYIPSLMLERLNTILYLNNSVDG